MSTVHPGILTCKINSANGKIVLENFSGLASRLNVVYVCVCGCAHTVCVYGSVKTLELADLQVLAFAAAKDSKKLFSADHSLCENKRFEDPDTVVHIKMKPKSTKSPLVQWNDIITMLWLA